MTACTQEPAQPPQQESAVDSALNLVTTNGCIACHSLEGALGVGPSWKGIYGKTVTFTDGRSAVVDDAYLRRAMLDPAADVVEGYQNVMVPAAVTEAQIADIIELIKGLGN